MRTAVLSRAMMFLTALAAIGVLAYVIASSVRRPLFNFDSWWYHLPLSAFLLNIGDARSTFIPADAVAQFYAGFPLVAEFLQGALWKLTGTINSITLINSCAIAAFVAIASRGNAMRVTVLTFGALTVPLIVLHSASVYIDLFVGVALCLQVVAATAMADSLRSSALRLVGYIAAASVAGNSKYMALVLSLAISGYLAGYVILRRRRFERRQWTVILAGIAVASALSAATVAKNTLQHHNPFYPIALELPRLGIHLAGPQKEYRNYPDYTAQLGLLAKPANWVLSITEIDWRIRGVKRVYNLDSNTGDVPQRHGPVRTGGYWGAYIAALFAAVAVLAVIAWRRNREGVADNAFFFSLFAFLTCVTIAMPQSHELRYYLYWPLLLLLGLCVLIETARLGPAARAAICLAFIGAFLMSQQMLGRSLHLNPRIPQAESIKAAVGSSEVEFARRTGGACLGRDYFPNQLMYASLFHGGTYVIEQGYPACRHLPEYVK